jgi:bilin biosynthesis protein
MDKRFFNIFGLTEDQALSILQTPKAQLADRTDRYVAVSHLINFPTERSIAALMEIIKNPGPDLYDRITRRKAVECLGFLQAKEAVPAIRTCLADEDRYTVENAVWALGNIGTEDEEILSEISHLLEKPDQSYRVIIQTLAKLDYKLALEQIQNFVNADDETIVSASISAICRLSEDYSKIYKILEFLQHERVIARRSAIQDLIDTSYYQAIPEITRCPVSIVFRLRGIRLLASVGMADNKISFATIEPNLNRVILDHPNDLNLVHEYDQNPSLDFLIHELYHTDFGRCYLASKTLLESYPDEAPEALLQAWKKEAHNDYGAHYHVVKILGWLKYTPAYNLLIEALQNPTPQFQKSRAAAAIALGNLGHEQAIPFLKEALSTKIFDLKYACLLALDQLGDHSGLEIAVHDSDELIRAKVNMFR